MTKHTFPEAHDRIAEAIEAGKLQAGSWGDGNEAVCMMSAAVTGAQSAEDCVIAGWPEWLVSLNVYLFDAEVGVADEDKARARFALDVADALRTPRDLDPARDLFLLARLDTGEHSALATLRSLPGDVSQQIEAVERVVALLHRRLAGEDVAEAMAAADAAARAAADAAAEIVADAAARAAARAAANVAAEAAVWAVEGDAAEAAARTDLITALRAS